MENQIIKGDCFEVMKDIPDNYFDSLITDPPAGISFMGKDWDKNKGGMVDWINWFSDVMSECLRVMKPGACGLVWSLPRTSHWTGMALELAGFKVIDICHHCQGEGFPKGQDVSKQIDQLLGEEREVIGKKTGAFMLKSNEFGQKGINGTNYDIPISIPSSPEAKQWDGWKTPALKPAVEGWWLVQKPISESSIARNILKHGVGGLNIEECRIEPQDKESFNKNWDRETVSDIRGGNFKNAKSGAMPSRWDAPTGRYPANLILSCGANCKSENHSPDCPVTVIGEQSGVSLSVQSLRGCTGRHDAGDSTSRNIKDYSNSVRGHSDTGTAARFFKQLPFDPETIPSVYYQSKASPKDRSSNGRIDNTHPTVKSRHLMKYLITLITPENGIVLDPFCGSGTTAVACKELNRKYICIEKEQEYFNIACDRINQPREYSEVEVEANDLKQVGFEQMSLF